MSKLVKSCSPAAGFWEDLWRPGADPRGFPDNGGQTALGECLAASAALYRRRGGERWRVLGQRHLWLQTAPRVTSPKGYSAKGSNREALWRAGAHSAGCRGVRGGGKRPRVPLSIRGWLGSRSCQSQGVPDARGRATALWELTHARFSVARPLRARTRTGTPHPPLPLAVISRS